MNPFSKTSYGKAPNYNNFFGGTQFQQEQKRNNTANSGKLRSDKYMPLMKKIKDSPYYSKEVQKRYTVTSNTSANKPILTSFKKQEGRFGRSQQHACFQQTTNNFDGFVPRNRDPFDEQRFCETVTGGFMKNERPISKQQARTKGYTIKQPDEPLESTSNYIQSDAEDMDEGDREMIQDIENDSLFMDRTDITDRPQTSKGLRKKSNTSDMHFDQEDEDLLLELNQRPPCRKKVDFGLNDSQQLKIPIRSMYADGTPPPRRFAHPISAHFRQDNAKKAKKVDDMIKFNVSSFKKSNSQMSVPFETSIGADFLSLFANGSINLQ